MPVSEVLRRPGSARQTVRTSNVELRTSNVEVNASGISALRRSKFDVGRWTFAFSSSQSLCCLLIALLLPLLQLGCAASAAVVTVKPINAKQSMTINFTRACIQKDPSGEDQIVLESDPIDQPPNAPADQPLQPVTAPPLWQVLVIQLHWRTAAAGVHDSSAPDNAVMHWYVYGKPDDTGTALLHYLGTGAVSVSTNNTGAAVSIRNAELRLVDQHGHLRDPLVDFRISTSFHAIEDPIHLREIMDDLNQAIAEAGANGSSAK